MDETLSADLSIGKRCDRAISGGKYSVECGVRTLPYCKIIIVSANLQMMPTVRGYNVLFEFHFKSTKTGAILFLFNS